MSKKIPLTQGKFTIVDDDIFDRFCNLKWQAHFSNGNWYAVREIWIDKSHKTLRMHSLIMGRSFIDHISGDGLDNRRENLRLATPTQNQQNKAKKKFLSSKFKGVAWHKDTGKWQSRITLNRKTIYLGIFGNEIDAARAYDKKAKELFGEFARPNFS